MERIIKEIKEEGFLKIKNEIEVKTQLKCQIEESIEQLKLELNALNAQNKKFGKKNLIYEQNTTQSLQIKDRLRYDSSFVVKNFDYLKQEIENGKAEIDYYLNDSHSLKVLHQDEINNLTLIKDHIKKINLSISSVNKEKEALLFNIKQIKKHKDQLQMKILSQTKSTKDFMKNVLDFEDKFKKATLSKVNRMAVSVMKQKNK